MPTLAGFTEILTTPCLSETPLLRMPAPCARTRTPGTRLPRRVTTALIVPRLPTVSVFVDDGQRRAHRRRVGTERAPLTSVGSSSRLLAVFVSASAPTMHRHVQDRARLQRPHTDRHRDRRADRHRADRAGHDLPGAEHVPCVELDER